MDIQNNAFKVRIQPIRPPQELFVSLGTRRSRTQDARDSTHVQTSAAAARTLNQHDCCIVRSGAWLFSSNTRGGKNGVVWSFLAGRVCDRPGLRRPRSLALRKRRHLPVWCICCLLAFVVPDVVNGLFRLPPHDAREFSIEHQFSSVCLAAAPSIFWLADAPGGPVRGNQLEVGQAKRLRALYGHPVRE